MAYVLLGTDATGGVLGIDGSVGNLDGPALEQHPTDRAFPARSDGDPRRECLAKRRLFGLVARLRRDGDVAIHVAIAHVKGGIVSCAQTHGVLDDRVEDGL